MTDQHRANSNRPVLWGAIARLGTCVVYPLIVFLARCQTMPKSSSLP